MNEPGRPFGTLLVANRGEIAIRVMRSAQAMGLRTVAVYSDADRESPHVRAATTAIHIGGTPAADSYLSIDALLRAATTSGAEAVHPGYGFLSERADFARAVADAGLVFVGPDAEVMDLMARKDHAREVAIRAGVPVVPSWELDGQAGSAPPERMDFPVLVKAAAGGGGKGMRVVRTPEELQSGIAAAQREAVSAFGDGTLLIEKYVERGRHVEVQVLGDRHGHVVHLFERDCSTQRRHQKVLEEAPAPTIDAALRGRITEAAVALSAEVGYTNAGTVEFLVDEATGEAYFLEMNTRLQVEHPVTESVVRINGRPLDLVSEQLRIAMGEELGYGQESIAVSGHSIEARVYAEDAFGGFLPQAGRASLVRWSDRARNDVALESGQEVSSAYDPMIGKVIVRGPDREAARGMLVAALDDTAILGLTTNLGFVRGIAASSMFRDCAMDTAWLDRNPGVIEAKGKREAAVFAAWAVAEYEIAQQPDHPFGTSDGWRLCGPSAPATIPLITEGEQTRWSVSWRKVTGPDGEISTRLISREPDRIRLEIDGRIRSAAVMVDARRVHVVHRGNTFEFVRPDPFEATASGPGDDVVVSPMPGTTLSVSVSVGERVEEGEVLGAVEAMKMEHALRAPFGGVVARVGAVVGKQVALGDVLFVITPDEGGSDG